MIRQKKIKCLLYAGVFLDLFFKLEGLLNVYDTCPYRDVEAVRVLYAGSNP